LRRRCAVASELATAPAIRWRRSAEQVDEEVGASTVDRRSPARGTWPGGSAGPSLAASLGSDGPCVGRVGWRRGSGRAAAAALRLAPPLPRIASEPARLPPASTLDTLAALDPRLRRSHVPARPVSAAPSPLTTLGAATTCRRIRRVYDVAVRTAARHSAPRPVRSASATTVLARARGPAAGVQLRAARRLQQDGAPHAGAARQRRDLRLGRQPRAGRGARRRSSWAAAR
jgi:hypothetical protein